MQMPNSNVHRGPTGQSLKNFWGSEAPKCTEVATATLPRLDASKQIRPILHEPTWNQILLEPKWLRTCNLLKFPRMFRIAQLSKSSARGLHPDCHSYIAIWCWSRTQEGWVHRRACFSVKANQSSLRAADVRWTVLRVGDLQQRLDGTNKSAPYYTNPLETKSYLIQEKVNLKHPTQMT